MIDSTNNVPLPCGRSPKGISRLFRGWGPRRRLAAGLLVALSLLPVFYLLVRTTDARRDLVYWDEFDSALALVLRLKEGTTPGAFLHDFVGLNNEHRMVTSRLLFATSYWLTGTINFAVFDWIGIAWIFVMCGLLLVAARSGMRRLRLGVLLAFVLFQLEHYENFLWAGASIDHFQVVMLAAASIIALARGTGRGVLAGSLLAVLATFTLAHGLMIWPVGAVMLWYASNRRGLVTWLVIGGIAAGFFLAGFQVNRAQAFTAFSLEGALSVVHYWLSILGAVPALGYNALAPVLGGVLLVLLGVATARGSPRREPISISLTLFVIAASGMIALGRAAVSGGEVYSRYYVLSGVAWALTLFMLLERHSHPRRPFRMLVVLLPALIAFNVAANTRFAAETDSWVEARDRAVSRFTQQGIDGRETFTLHPNPAHSTALLRKAEKLGVYRLGEIVQPLPFPADAIVSGRIVYFVDEMTVNARSAFIRGWAAIPGLNSERGQIKIVLRSATETYLFTTVSISRPDVAKVTNHPEWELSGFRFAHRRDRLPTGEYQVGLLFSRGGESEYVMTAHRVILVGEGQALLASGD